MISATDLPVRAWRKSSYSGQNGGNCLEVADDHTGAGLPVRDSKNPHGPTLLFTDQAWTAFLAHVRDRQSAVR
ncbi:DUF397 domain-containing protein [Streptomyces diacarni]|uniref:DUF397 domain-containing protein n=1 Tax=Streptomyces diacarni TaxID=2800381 RepID=UPI0033FE1C56